MGKIRGEAGNEEIASGFGASAIAFLLVVSKWLVSRHAMAQVQRRFDVGTQTFQNLCHQSKRQQLIEK
jgi:hypothetical protein